eukprot:SM000142S00522  [mRNA]  locus=s142:139190:139987:- [translate_table: standard]
MAMPAVMHETPTAQVVAAVEVARRQELEVAAAMHAHQAAMEAAEAARHVEPTLPAPLVLEGTFPNGNGILAVDGFEPPAAAASADAITATTAATATLLGDAGTQPPQPPPLVTTLASSGGWQSSASAELSSPLSSKHAPSHLDLKLLAPTDSAYLVGSSTNSGAQ